MRMKRSHTANCCRQYGGLTTATRLTTCVFSLRTCVRRSKPILNIPNTSGQSPGSATASMESSNLHRIFMVVLLLLQVFSPTAELQIPRWWTEKKFHSSSNGLSQQPECPDGPVAAKAPGLSSRLSLHRLTQRLLRGKWQPLLRV